MWVLGDSESRFNHKTFYNSLDGKKGGQVNVQEMHNHRMYAGVICCVFMMGVSLYMRLSQNVLRSMFVEASLNGLRRF